jgi:hypothetical protein
VSELADDRHPAGRRGPDQGALRSRSVSGPWEGARITDALLCQGAITL